MADQIVDTSKGWSISVRGSACGVTLLTEGTELVIDCTELLARQQEQDNRIVQLERRLEQYESEGSLAKAAHQEVLDAVATHVREARN